ncbi:hypothetical protein [Streptococcus suis]|uniref:hypothetical protein n=1 Tax=Streptococcus suis TaxID=1307 RepID=UPI00041E93DF|nr:hypothetical protein [Streptococcus suis]
MKLLEFAAIIKALGIPCRYRQFKKGEKTKPPYAVYYQDGEDNLNADNEAYHTVKSVTVELITDKKNESLEDKLKSLFNQNKLFFEFSDEMYIESEGLYQVIYDVSLI